MNLLLTCAAEEENTYLLVQPEFDKDETAVVMPYIAHSLGSLTLRLLMSYIYGAPILDVSRSHTTTQHIQ